jgi:hypothetical protein
MFLFVAVPSCWRPVMAGINALVVNDKIIFYAGTAFIGFLLYFARRRELHPQLADGTTNYQRGPNHLRRQNVSLWPFANPVIKCTRTITVIEEALPLQCSRTDRRNQTSSRALLNIPGLRGTFASGYSAAVGQKRG